MAASRIPLRLPIVLSLLAATAAAVARPLPAAAQAARPDPVVTDPVAPDEEHPPAMRELVIESGGERMNALMYLANGPGPHPTVVLLHGYPGNERNLDLAQAIRRAGGNVLYFNYRGTWGSGGRFSFLGSADDAAAAVEFLRAEGANPESRIDPRRIALIGHSFGGFTGMMAAAEDPGIACLGFMAGSNLGRAVAPAVRNPEAMEAAAASLGAAMHPESGPVRADPREAIREVADAGPRTDLTTRARAFAGRRVLMVAGDRDRTTPRADNHDPIVAALEAAGARVTEVVFNDDHSFSASRIALARAVVDWLQGACWR